MAGSRHHLEVTEDPAGAGLIFISDHGMTRILSITAAFDLAWQVVAMPTRLRRLEDGEVGPFSSTF